MISKHSHEQSERGEGVEVVQNEPYEDPNYGQGQFTEKRIYLNKWVATVINYLSRQNTSAVARFVSTKCLMHYIQTLLIHQLLLVFNY